MGTATLTKCPKCATTFRVTEEQLGVADGLVRCGECMQVFAALENRQDLPAEKSEERETDTLKPEEYKSEASTLEEYSEPDPDFAASDEPDVDGALRFARDILAKQASAGVTSADATPSGHQHKEADGVGNEEIDDADLLFDDLGARHEKDVVAEELLRTEAKRESEFDTAFFDSLNEAGEFSDPGGIKAEDSPPVNAVAIDDPRFWDETLVRQPDETPEQDSDTRWASELIESLHREQSRTRSARESASNYGDLDNEATRIQAATARANDKTYAAADDFSFDHDGELDVFNASGEIDRQFEELGPFGDDYDDEYDEYANDFAAARRGGWLWALGIFALALLLVAQYLFFNFNSVATDSTFRPFLARVCGALPCDLPVLENLQKISSEKLVVRSHPDKSKSDALIVDVIITNHADFAQPFPALKLTFSDLRGKVVSTEKFNPKQYLHGELTGLTLMPTRNPIHLELDIADPGKNAINYKLELVKGYD